MVSNRAALDWKRMASRTQKRMVETGSRAPEFHLKDAAGRERSLGELLAEGPVLLAFFKTTCPTCQLTFPFLDRMAGSRSLRIFGVSQDDPETTAEFNQEFGVNFPILYDEERRGYPASNDYGISYVPSIFIVEPDGKIGSTLVGFSRQGLEEMGRRAGVTPFRADEVVPEWRSG